MSLYSVLTHVDGAQRAGVYALLLAPVSYQRLTEEEVFGLYDAVNAAVDCPIILYDNPGTTGFTFSPEPLIRIAELEHIESIKLPNTVNLAALRLGSNASLGISGDGQACEGLIEGCDVWFSVIAGT